MMYHEQYDTWGPGGHVGTFRGNVPAFVGGTRAIEYIESHNLSTTRQKSGRTSGRGSVNWPKRYPKSSTSVEKDNSRALSSK